MRKKSRPDESISNFDALLPHDQYGDQWRVVSSGAKRARAAVPSGRRYRYFGVPAVVAERFSAALSKGQFFNREIRNHYRCRELDAELSQVA